MPSGYTGLLQAGIAILPHGAIVLSILQHPKPKHYHGSIVNTGMVHRTTWVRTRARTGVLPRGTRVPSKQTEDFWKLKTFFCKG